MLDEELLRKIRQIALIARKKAQNIFAGSYHSVFRGKGIEFEEVREYQFGDDLGSIDWNVTARNNRLYIKRFREERELTTILAVDLSHSMHFFSAEKSKLEIASEIAAILTYAALLNNDKVGLLLFTGKIELFIPPRKGKAHALRIIREILTFKPENRKTDLPYALNFLNQNLKKRAIIFLVSDFKDFVFSNDLKICKKKHDLIAVKISDPLERTVLPRESYSLLNSETEELFRFKLQKQRDRRRLEEMLQQEQQFLKKSFNSLNIDQIEINIAEDYLFELVKFFWQRRLRR